MAVVIFSDSSGDDVTLLDLLLWISALTVYLGYMVRTFVKFQKDPTSIHLGMNLRARRQWIRFVMCTPGQEIMSIQAMRNSIMESSFLGTICSTIAFYILSLALNAFNDNQHILGIKYVVLSFSMFWAFMTFAYAIRNYNHVGFLATVKSSPKEVDVLLDQYNHLVTKRRSEEPVSDTVLELEDFNLPLTPAAEVVHAISDKVDQHRASLIPAASKLICGAVVAHFVGLRLFYFSILVGMTVISPTVVLIASIVLVGGIFCLDHY